jgi:hypothetical protein
MRKIISFLFIFLTSFFFVSPSNVSAKVISMQKGSVEIGKDEIINDDLFAYGESVDIEGTVNGDVYVGAGTVRVNGIINGDLHVGAGIFYLGGKVRDDVYVGAGNVTLSKATVGDSLLVGSGNVNIDTSSTIGGSLLAGSGTINVYAPVKRNVFIGGGSVDINSTVGGEVRLAAGQISIGPNTKIGKDLYYTFDEKEKELKMSETASVSGKIQKLENKFITPKEIVQTKGDISRVFKSLNLIFKLFALGGAYIVGYLSLRFFPKTFSQSAGYVTNSFFKSMGVGLLVCLAAIPVLFMLALTGVGIPLAGLLLLIFILNLYLSTIVVSYSLGGWISEKFGWKKMSINRIFAVGLIAVFILKSIPFFGIVFALMILWSGLGALGTYYKVNILKS